MTQITKHETVWINYRREQFIVQHASMVITETTNISFAYDVALRYIDGRTKDFPHIKTVLKFDDYSCQAAYAAGMKRLADNKRAEVLAAVGVRPKRAVRLA